MRGLPSSQNRVDDIGREKGALQNTSDIPYVQAQLFGNFCRTGNFSSDNPVTPFVRACQRFQERRNWSCGWFALRIVPNHKPQLTGTTFEPSLSLQADHITS